MMNLCLQMKTVLCARYVLLLSINRFRLEMLGLQNKFFALVERM